MTCLDRHDATQKWCDHVTAVSSIVDQAKKLLNKTINLKDDLKHASFQQYIFHVSKTAVTLNISKQIQINLLAIFLIF